MGQYSIETTGANNDSNPNRGIQLRGTIRADPLFSSSSSLFSYEQILLQEGNSNGAIAISPAHDCITNHDLYKHNKTYNSIFDFKSHWDSIKNMMKSEQQQEQNHHVMDNNTNTNTMSLPLSNTSSSNLTSSCGRWFCRLLHLCNTFAAVFLSVAVGFLFVQVQMLQSSIAAEDKLLKDLQYQLQTQQQSQQTLNQRVDNEHSFTLYQLAGTFTLLTCLITMFHMTQHLSNWNEPVIQRKIVAILWMSPIYSITSWFSLVFIQAHGYLAVIKDFYESLVIYSFLSFLIAVLGRGDRNVAILALSYRADDLKKPTRCFSSCYHPPPTESDQAKAAAVLLECQIWAMQFVLVRPITSILHYVVEQIMLNKENDNDNTTGTWGYFESPVFAIDMVTNVSVFLAFHGLLKFYHTVHRDLKWCKPFNKFMTVKGIVFLTFWQGLLISILCNINEEELSSNSSSAITLASGATGGNGNGNRFRFLLSGGDDALVNTTLMPIITSLLNNTLDDGGIIGNGIVNSTRPFVDNNPYTNTTIGGGGEYGFFPTSSPIGAFETNSTSGSATTEPSARERAAQIQNFLICLEMLFFTIAHWCVFPAQEWEPNYRPQRMAKPGIGLKDLASDISYIVSSSSSARKYNQRQLGQHMHLKQVDEHGTEFEDEVVSFDSDDEVGVDVDGVAPGGRSYELPQYPTTGFTSSTIDPNPGMVVPNIRPDIQQRQDHHNGGNDRDNDKKECENSII